MVTKCETLDSATGGVIGLDWIGFEEKKLKFSMKKKIENKIKIRKNLRQIDGVTFEEKIGNKH